MVVVAMGVGGGQIMMFFVFVVVIRRPPRSTQSRSSAASDVYKRQEQGKTLEQLIVELRGRAVRRAKWVGGKYVAGKYTCLLYTSPSPRDRTSTRMPSSA